jgi:hypothetical protein
LNNLKDEKLTRKENRDYLQKIEYGDDLPRGRIRNEAKDNAPKRKEDENLRWGDDRRGGSHKNESGQGQSSIVANKRSEISSLNSDRKRSENSRKGESHDKERGFGKKVDSREYLNRADKLTEREKNIEKKRQSLLRNAPKKWALGFGAHEAFKTDKDTGEKASVKKSGFYVKKRVLNEGERNFGQKASFGVGRLPAVAIVKDFRNAEYKNEGNEAVQMADRGVTQFKEKVIKPFIRRHTGIGFDRKQYKAQKLKERRNLIAAKADILRANSKATFSSNAISRAMQKRSIRREMYAKHNVRNRGLLARIGHGGLKSISLINPIEMLRRQATLIAGMLSAAFTLIKVSLMGAIIILVVVVPAIAVVNIFSIFFGFGNDDPNPEIAKANEYYSEAVVDMRMSLITAFQTQSWPGYGTLGKPLHELNIKDDYNMGGQFEYKRQIKLVGYLAAYYNDGLTDSVVRDAIDELISEVFTISEYYRDEGWWEGDDDNFYWVHHWVLDLEFIAGDYEGYIQGKLESIPDEDAKTLALTQYEQYQKFFGFGQIGGNPFWDSFNWMNNITSTYGYRIFDNQKKMHYGLDISCPENTPLSAIMDGYVVETGYNDILGNYIKYETKLNNAKFLITYEHLRSYKVSEGDLITKDQEIAFSGDTGTSTGPHLHIQVEKMGFFGNTTLNPLFLIEFPDLRS